MRESSLEFSGLLPHFQPVEEEIGNFKPDFEPLCNFLLLTALFLTKPDVCRHALRALLASCDEFPGKAGADAVRNFAVLPVECVNLLERNQRTIEISKLKMSFFVQFMMIRRGGLLNRIFISRIFHSRSCRAQDAGDIGKARSVMVVRASAQFSLNGAKFPRAGSFQVVLFAVSQDDSLVLVRVKPPRQNSCALPPFLPYFLCVRCEIPALSGARCRSAAACFRYRATLRWCSASVLAK
jgi:hypothetical protein